MDPLNSFLFFLFLALLVALVTASDVVSWFNFFRKKPVKKKPRRPMAAVIVPEGRVEDRKQQ